jgi:hypothetical protein
LRGRVAREEGRLLVGLAAAFLAMTLAGLAVAASDGDVIASLGFGTVMGVVMGVEVAYLIHRYYRGRMARPWLMRASDESETSSEEAGARMPSTRTPHPVDRPAAGR